MSEPAEQIVARGPRRRAEAAAARLDADPRLEGVAYSILEEDEVDGVWRIDAFPSSREDGDAILRALGTDPELSVSRETLADADWLALALSGLPPVRAGRFFVYGAHDRGRVPANAVALRIEAGAAFGTGHHGTTVGCLLAYDARLRRTRPRRVLDVGTGTGVLAIAAARTGARHVVATDIDPVSARIARENAALNGARLRAVCAAGLTHTDARRAAPYDLVFANILAGPLVRLARPIARVLDRRGVVILSGLLRQQERTVLAAYRAQGLRLVRRLRREAWSTLVVGRRPR